MKINIRSGLPLQIYLPNVQTIQPFEFEFYTNATAPKSQNLVVSYDGTTYTGCQPWAKGVYLYSTHHFTGGGPLLCRATYFVPNPMCDGRLQKICFDDLPTDIEWVEHGGAYFDPIPKPEKLPIPSFNNPTCSHIPA